MKTVNPKGPDAGFRRSLHGGSYYGSVDSLVVSVRDKGPPGACYSLSFRITCNERKK